MCTGHAALDRYMFAERERSSAAVTAAREGTLAPADLDLVQVRQSSGGPGGMEACCACMDVLAFPTPPCALPGDCCPLLLHEQPSTSMAACIVS